MRVMRKHRIAECMLVDLLQVEWEDVHAEACRWEHVMSTEVELKILKALGNPTVSPFGNPIPGIDELLPGQAVQASGPSVPLSDVASEEVSRVIVRRIAEPIQTHGATMTRLRRVGAVPGASVKVHTAAGGVMIGSAGEYTELSLDDALHVLVQPA